MCDVHTHPHCVHSHMCICTAADLFLWPTHSLITHHTHAHAFAHMIVPLVRYVHVCFLTLVHAGSELLAELGLLLDLVAVCISLSSVGHLLAVPIHVCLHHLHCHRMVTLPTHSSTHTSMHVCVSLAIVAECSHCTCVSLALSPNGHVTHHSSTHTSIQGALIFVQIYACVPCNCHCPPKQAFVCV